MAEFTFLHSEIYMRKKVNGFIEPSAEEIAAYAYYLWESEGRQSGRDLDYWLDAKAHLEIDRKFEAGLLPSPSKPAQKGQIDSRA